MAESHITLQTPLEKVDDSRNTFLSRQTKLDEQMAQIHSSVNALNKQTANVQTSVSATEDYIVDADKKITGPRKTVEALAVKMDYLEKKSW